ncbi:MAG: restriction endonuclease subunit S [Thermoguttaceae bacterium]|nr:restriction endonuclease subunit S [Thermoguttaceae bacterium]
MKSELNALCSYAKEKIAVSELTKRNYISTENMAPNRGGVAEAATLPTTEFTQRYRRGDVLVSNIRPYFKKIWLAKEEGGCSNDVLVFRAADVCEPAFLYYVLADDAFFDYSTSTAKGTKMPRGDKSAIMKYEVPVFERETQRKIAAILSALDDKIELNRRINANLEQQAFAIFANLLENACSGECRLAEIVEFGPKYTLCKNNVARCVEMKQLSTVGSFPLGWETQTYQGGTRFTNGDTLLARITPCLENGKAAYVNFLEEGEIAFGSTEYIVMRSRGVYPAEFFYCLARNPEFVDYAIKNLNGTSGRQRVSSETLGEYTLPRLSEKEMAIFRNAVSPSFEKIRNNGLENIALAAVRDALLPRLMSGEIDVDDVKF